MAVVELDRRGGLQAGPTEFFGGPQRDGSYSPQQMWSLIRDSRHEPRWRRNAEVEMAYYDGDQLTMETLRRMKANGIPPVIVNMIAPAVDSVTGFERITRTDPRVFPEDDDSIEGAEALNEELKRITRLADFDEACGDAFATAVKIGLGWLEVARAADPLASQYRCGEVPWREMWPDWRARKKDLSDARYIVRRQWKDRDELAVYFPQHRDQLSMQQLAWPDGFLTQFEDLDDTDRSSELMHGFDQEQRFTLEEDEWRQQGRHRLPLYEILYRVPQRLTAIRFPDGRTIEWNENNPMQVRAIIDKQAVFTTGVTMKLRQAFYAGPHRLYDEWIEDNLPHYIPIVAKRKDSDRSPYGLIRPMKTNQEAINARYSRILNDQSARRVVVDEDAVEDHDETRAEVGRPDAYLVLKKDRMRAEGFKILENVEQTPMAFQMLQEGKRNISDVTGIYPDFQGQQTQTGERSGVAIEGLIEQVQQTLGSLADNYRRARRMAAVKLLSLRVEDLSGMDDYGVNVERPMQGRPRHVVLNARAGGEMRDNDVLMLRTHVALSEQPKSATYRQQKLQSWAEIVKALPPEIQTALVDFTVRMTDHPDTDEILERIRQVTGFGPEPKDPELRAMIEEERARRKELQERLEGLELAGMDADVRQKMATAREKEAKAVKARNADTDLTLANADLARAQATKALAEAESESASIGLAQADGARKDLEVRAKFVEGAARLRREDNADAERARKEKEQKAKPAAKK